MPAARRLSPEAVVTAAVAVADRAGLAGVSMRTVGRELGVEAMSLYHHVAHKAALLDALTEWAIARIDLPRADEPWRAGMVRRARSARAVLAAHPWALGLLESRTSPGPALLTHHDAVIGCLRAGGFPVRLAAHAFAVIDAYVYGFVLTEQSLPFDARVGGEADFAASIDLPAEAYPHLAELVGALVADPAYAFADEFDYGLDVILDELARRLEAPAGDG